VTDGGEENFLRQDKFHQHDTSAGGILQRNCHELRNYADETPVKNHERRKKNDAVEKKPAF
jgi:hypothetical protein